jgi:hypothetical protein
MNTLEIIETTKPTYQTTLENGQRLALWPELGLVAREDVIGDLVSVQTLKIDRHLNPISTDDEHRGPIAEILEVHHGDRDAQQMAISKHLDRAGLSHAFVSLRGYSQGEWAEVVAYSDSELIGYWGSVAEDLNAWFRGDVFSLELQTLKVYKAEDSTELARWDSDQHTGLVLISDSYGMKDGDIDWETLALDNFGIHISEGNKK